KGRRYRKVIVSRKRERTADDHARLVGRLSLLLAAEALRPRLRPTRLAPSRKTLFGWPRSSPSGTSYPLQQFEWKSWALPAAATNRKTKIPPTREFLAHTDFLHRLLRETGVGPVQHGGRWSIPGHAAPQPRCWPLSATSANRQRSEARGETLKPRMPRGEVPIKPGSSDGGLARERPREIRC